jgi:hypothetical protein
MMQELYVKLNKGFWCKSENQQEEEGSFRQKTGFIFKEETAKVLQRTLLYIILRKVEHK